MQSNFQQSNFQRSGYSYFGANALVTFPYTRLVVAWCYDPMSSALYKALSATQHSAHDMEACAWHDKHVVVLHGVKCTLRL